MARVLTGLRHPRSEDDQKHTWAGNLCDNVYIVMYILADARCVFVVGDRL
jgi:hypothetical protein